jgi:hypothetical protein
MVEHPILFNSEMVKAVLSGTKRQTRRVIKPQPKFNRMGLTNASFGRGIGNQWGFPYASPERWYKCPYGLEGQRLWVRETFWIPPGERISKSQIVFRADKPNFMEGRTINKITSHHYKWRPSIFMPRWASRITLQVDSVRVERVQDIREADAMAEGIREVTKDGVVKKYCVYDHSDYSSTPWRDMPRNPVHTFMQLWDSINDKRGYSWASNPWVWVVDFHRVGE